LSAARPWAGAGIGDDLLQRIGEMRQAIKLQSGDSSCHFKWLIAFLA
jgi:hypothetical protein